MACNCSAEVASKRRTNAGCVLEARMSPQPSSKQTRTPSIVITSRITRLGFLEFVAFGCLAASTSRFRTASTNLELHVVRTL